MSQVLSIRFSKTPLPQAEVFLAEWQRIGTWLPAADNTYELRSHSGDNLLLTFAEAELEITGYTQDDTFSFIEGFSRRFGGELLHEGESLQEEDVSRWKTLGPLTKAAGILVIIVLLPLLIVALPILLLVLFGRLAFHFFRLSRSGRAKP